MEALGTNPWERLANAIIWQAAEDYRTKESRTELEKLDRFFRSAGFSALCGLDGETLLARLKEEKKRNGYPIVSETGPVS
ncbi:MAG: hypothetical protein II442_08275 [Oscillospiraceae bacterium]|nr:hypothetical protein [Oscillospiraceae bacterium]